MATRPSRQKRIETCLPFPDERFPLKLPILFYRPAGEWILCHFTCRVNGSGAHVVMLTSVSLLTLLIASTSGDLANCFAA